MKTLRGLDGSVCGTIFTTRTSSSLPVAVAQSSQVRERRPLRSLSLAHHETRNEPPHSESHISRSPTQNPPLCYCPQSSSWLWSTFFAQHAAPRPSRPTTSLHRNNTLRTYSHAAAAAEAPATEKNKLLAYVDNDDPGSVEEYLELVRDPFLRRYAQPNDAAVTISENPRDISYPSTDEAVRGDPAVQKPLAKLRPALSSRLRHPQRVSLDMLYKTYQRLPQPRMLHVPAHIRNMLFKAFGKPKTPDLKAMFRYFQLVGDVKQCGLTLRRAEWNTALALASRSVGRTASWKTESVLQLWNEMEKIEGHNSNEVTFSVLFDAAAKSGNFPLAERIFQEMEKRGLQFNRYHHVSLIHFFGLKGESDGIRAAYKEMVNAGEMIDTVVFNCLIASFLKARDEPAALRVYDHMKMSGGNTLPETSDNATTSKRMAEVYMMFAELGRRHPSMRSSLQGTAATSPNLQTYRVLLNHYAWTAGNFHRVSQFLDEMKWYSVMVDGATFLVLFKSFAKHGGFRRSQWTKERLRDVFKSLLVALDQPDSKLRIETWLAGWALRAFMRCDGEDAVMEAYRQLQARWTLKEDRAAHMEQFLHEVLEGQSPGYFRWEMESRGETDRRQL